MSYKKNGRQDTASPQEVAERKANMKTQGRKGCKATRINMAFTPENHEFIKVMARASGHTMTEFTNLVIAAYQKEHPEIMMQARGFLATLNSGDFYGMMGKIERLSNTIKEQQRTIDSMSKALEKRNFVDNLWVNV